MHTSRPHLRSRSGNVDLRQQVTDAAAHNGMPQPPPAAIQTPTMAGPDDFVWQVPSPSGTALIAPEPVVLRPLRRAANAYGDLRAARRLHTPGAAGARYSRSGDSASRLRSQPAVNDLELLRTQQAHGVPVQRRAPAMPPPYWVEPPPYEPPANPHALGLAEVDRILALPRPVSPPPPYQPEQPQHVYTQPGIANYGTGLDLEEMADAEMPSVEEVAQMLRSAEDLA